MTKEEGLGGSFRTSLGSLRPGGDSPRGGKSSHEDAEGAKVFIQGSRRIFVLFASFAPWRESSCGWNVLSRRRRGREGRQGAHSGGQENLCALGVLCALARIIHGTGNPLAKTRRALRSPRYPFRGAGESPCSLRPLRLGENCSWSVKSSREDKVVPGPGPVTPAAGSGPPVAAGSARGSAPGSSRGSPPIPHGRRCPCCCRDRTRSRS